MKISKINLTVLRNEEHFQFQTEFKSLIEQMSAKTLNIEEQFAKWLIHYQNENEALNLIRKSATTEKLSEADNERDAIFRGMADAIKSAMNHFNEQKRQAASRLKILFESYGNIARKPYDEETAAINKLIQECRGQYANDVASLPLNDWINELELKNIAFDTLMKNRYSEEAGRTELRMNQVRTEINTAYKTIIERIEALIVVNGLNGYETFVREMNSRIEKFNDIFAQRKGRGSKNGDKPLEQLSPVIEPEKK